MMKNMLEVTFTGSVKAPELGRLRTSLGLSKHGRLSDDWDDDFGSRELSPRSSGWIYLILVRDLQHDGWWKVSLTHEENPLPAADVDMWEQKIIAAITEAGLAIEEVKR
jgi:hypothetical protein